MDTKTMQMEYHTEDGSIEIEPNTEWVNYGDMNPQIHGGRFVRFEGDMWHVIETRDLEESGLEGMIQNGEKYLFEHHWYEPMDLFESGDPNNGPTDVFEQIIDSFKRIDGFENALVDHDIEFFVADLTHHIRGNSRDDYAENYWEYLEEYGITPNDE